MVSLAANWDPAGRRECNDAHLHGGIELDDRPDLLRGWRRFDYGHRIPVGNTGSRMNIRRACAGTPLYVRVNHFRVRLATGKITRGEVSRRQRRSFLRVLHYMTSGPRSTSPSDSFSWRPFINHFAWCHAFNFGAFLHMRAGYSCGSLYFQREYGVHNRSASIHVEDLAGHPTRFLHADEHRCIRDVLWGPSSPRGTPSDFMPGFNRLLHLRWETNQYTAIDQVSCTEDDARAE